MGGQRRPAAEWKLEPIPLAREASRTGYRQIRGQSSAAEWGVSGGYCPDNDNESRCLMNQRHSYIDHRIMTTRQL